MNTSSTETYKFPSGSKGTKVDLGADNKVRYVDGTAVYTTGYNKGYSSGKSAGYDQGIQDVMQNKTSTKPFSKLEPSDLRRTIALWKDIWYNSDKEDYSALLTKNFSESTALYADSWRDDVLANGTEKSSGSTTMYSWLIPLSTDIYTTTSGTNVEVYDNFFSVFDKPATKNSSTETSEFLDANLTYKNTHNYYRDFINAKQIVLYLYGVKPNDNYDTQTLEFDNVKESTTLYTKTDIRSIIPVVTLYKESGSEKISGIKSNCDFKGTYPYYTTSSGYMYYGTKSYDTGFNCRLEKKDGIYYLNLWYKCECVLDRQECISATRYDMYTAKGRDGFLKDGDTYVWDQSRRYRWVYKDSNSQWIGQNGENMLKSSTIWFCPVIEFYD